MRYNVPLYFERKNIKISDIFYLTRQNPHTIITLSSGESITTTIPIKELMLYLPEEDFLNISKGVVRLWRKVCKYDSSMIMIELEVLNWSFQLLFYIYDMISGMSRADVKNVLLIMHTDSAIPGVFPRT